MKTRYNPSVRELRKFASQFTEGEWKSLCENSTFLEMILTSIGRAAYHAAIILKRPVQFAYLRESVSAELASRLLEDAKRSASYNSHHHRM